MRKMLLQNWHAMRYFRLIMSLVFLFLAIKSTDFAAGFVSALFMFQTVTNTGCCGAGGCAIPNNKIETKEK